MQKLLLIAPNKNIKNSAESIIDKIDADIIIKEGVLLDGVESAKEELKKEHRTLISRGGTVKLLREHLNTTVIDIGVSTLDILRTLYPLKN